MTQGKRRLSPSKSSWTTGDKISTQYEKGCPRFVVWERRYEKDVDIDPIYEAMGCIDETRFATKLKRDGVKFEREVEISHPIGTTGINIEGRIDFVVETPEGTVIIEKKSTISPNRRRMLIEKKVVDRSHLAQVVSYMAVKKVQNGQIVVTFWKWDDTIDALIVDGEHAFQITVTPGGDITVDGTPYPTHVRQLQQWYKTCADGMNDADTRLPGRPHRTAYADPCKRCPLSSQCDQYDRSKNVIEFWRDTKDIEMSAGNAAVIVEPKATKLKKGKKNEQDQLPDSSNTNNDRGRIQDKTGLFGREMD